MALLAGVMVLVGGGCKKAAAPPPPPPPQVTVAQPLDQQVQEWDEFPGRLESTHPVQVRAQVSGYMQSFHFKEGAIVKKGDLLFRIDPRPFQAEVARNEGEVGRAKARLALAETEFKRTQSLVPSAAASELELDEKKANLAETQAALKVAEANLETATINLGYTEIHAEITGRISRANVKPGNLVSGGPNAPEASELTTIESLDPIYCYVDADERSVLKYQRLVREKKRPNAREGTDVPARLALLNERDFLHNGHIDFVDNRVDPTTGTLRARGVFPNPDGVMTPGLFGRMRVPGAEPYRSLLVAEAAVQSDQSTKYVLTVDEKNAVKITPVETGSLFGTLRSITSGLKGDERVIVNGILRARPGATVNPQPGEMPGAKDAAALATTRVVEAPPGSSTTAPSTAPGVAPSTAPTTEPSARGSDARSGSSVARGENEDSAAARPSSPKSEAATAGGGSGARDGARPMGRPGPVVGVATEVGR